MRVPCEVCGKTFAREETGRPRKYCSDRCKERAKRNRRREDERTAVARLADVRVDEGEPVCHVCAARSAVRGNPPILCNECSQAGRAP